MISSTEHMTPNSKSMITTWKTRFTSQTRPNSITKRPIINFCSFKRSTTNFLKRKKEGMRRSLVWKQSARNSRLKWSFSTKQVSGFKPIGKAYQQEEKSKRPEKAEREERRRSEYNSYFNQIKYKFSLVNIWGVTYLLRQHLFGLAYCQQLQIIYPTSLFQPREKSTPDY